jgi:hypothetical protein
MLANRTTYPISSQLHCMHARLSALDLAPSIGRAVQEQNKLQRHEFSRITTRNMLCFDVASPVQGHQTSIEPLQLNLSKHKISRTRPRLVQSHYTPTIDTSTCPTVAVTFTCTLHVSNTSGLGGAYQTQAGRNVERCINISDHQLSSDLGRGYLDPS